MIENSPCIDAGNPNDFDSDGSIRDIGSLIFDNFILGDCNQDIGVNILDIIFIINNCIFNNQSICSECSDIDLNSNIDILDIILLINIILQGN